MDKAQGLEKHKLDDPDLGVSEDTYNAYGELVTHEDAHGKTTYTYDAGGRVIKEERPDMTVNTAYDEGFKGKPSSVRLSGAFGGGKNWTYDGYGRVVKEQFHREGTALFKFQRDKNHRACG